MASNNVLLIGGSGFVGGWIANRLTEQGVRVRIPTRRHEHARRLTLLPTIETVVTDVFNPLALRELMRGQDAVINLVGILHDRDSRSPYGSGFARAHVELPQRIVTAMQESGVRRLVHMSALGTASDAPSEYLRSKAAGEAAAFAAEGIDVTAFRPSVIFGGGDAFLTLFARFLRLAPVFPLAGARARFQPVYAGDVAWAFCDCLDRNDTIGQRYDLAGPGIYTLRQLVEYTGEISGHPRPVIELPDAIAALQANLLKWLPNPPMTPDNLRSMQVDNVSDGTHDYPDWRPTPLEAVAPGYLSAQTPKGRLDDLRLRAGR
ncbi:complex I NDUFA9 subunit family protein [Rhodocyclus tenuis]|uniref:NAD(P)H-binding protein n=2 Tax=Rhodocyclus TaxID=1064 RepID=A0A6L5JWU3_RHOTE|nr:complex I NDUFA9 subunit family protein [Rhodocyclus gracilis]MQY51825.1 NAD(P)H-binding protein [Rhodocyclus gracilis]NJA88404.1 complex I NDUFA9 subunit family protein [Rhodocyclus gracilis]